MIVLFYLLLGVATIMVQTTMTEYFSVWTGARPDAMLLTTLFLGVYRGKETGLVGGFVLGLLQDAFSGGLLGANALSKGLIGHAAGSLQRNLWSRNFLFQAVIGCLATLFDIFLIAGLTTVFFPDAPLAGEFQWNGVKTLLLNTALTPLVVGMLGTAQRRILPDNGGIPYPTRI